MESHRSGPAQTLITALPPQFDVSDELSFPIRRALRYVGAAAALAVVIGFFQQGSLGRALVFGFAVGLGVAAGLTLFELIARS